MLMLKKVMDGIFFFIIGIALAIYSMVGYQNSFNKDVTQSPYLFPFIIAIFFVLLSISIMYQGAHSQTVDKPVSTKEGSDGKGVAGVLGLSALYYVVLKLAPLPLIMIDFNFFVLTIGNFEVASFGYLLLLLLGLGVRKKGVLTLVPIVVPIFLSITFRSMLFVMLP